MNLSKYTIEAIEHKLGVAQDTLDTLADDEEQECIDSWKETVKQLQAVINAGHTVEALRSYPAAIEELSNYMGNDMPKAEMDAINDDLCRIGYHDKFSSEAVYSRRPKTRVVEGVRYVVG